MPISTEPPAPARTSAIEVLRTRSRLAEPDRDLAALLSPRSASADLLALAAFTADLALVAASVSDPLIGEIRLQWWRDTIAAAATGTPVGHPVGDAMGEAIRRHGLDLLAIHRMIDARSFDLSGDLLADEAALQSYCADTEGIPFALATAVLGGPPLPGDVAGAMGLAYGLARKLGQLPALLQSGGFPLPASLLADAGVTPAALAEVPVSAATVEGVERVAARLEARARTASSMATMALGDLGTGARLAALPLAMIEPYFAAQKRRGFRRLEHIAGVLPFARVWRLWLARRRVGSP